MYIYASVQRCVLPSDTVINNRQFVHVSYVHHEISLEKIKLIYYFFITSSDTEYAHPTQHTNTSCKLDVHHDQGGNETVQTQDLGENEDEDHTDVELWLLGSSSDTGVTDDTNGETSSETR